MNRNTARRMKFVLYSPHTLVTNGGAGFWSNALGWVEFRAATQFSVQTVPSCNLPPADGHDAKWIMWEPKPYTACPVVAEPEQICLPLAA